MTWMTPLAKRALESRREQRKLTRDGYRRHETDWEIHRGMDYDKVIVDARISVCGKYVYTKLGLPVDAINSQRKEGGEG